ncbi:MAG TPA: MerR family transcriptional regulator [Solirubrobacter sp.]
MSDDAATGASDASNGGGNGEPHLEEVPRQTKSLTIGAVCKGLQQEFPDISISKIRYLEDQKLLTPRRTPGGYRLYSAADVSRLRTILRLQRDEFLPLAVIRQELAAGRSFDDPPAAKPGGDGAAKPAEGARPGAALRRLTLSVRDRGASYSLDDVVEQTGAEPRLVQELEDFGIVKGEVREGKRYYDETEREAALLQQILAPALRSRNPERRKEAVEALENLAAVASHLKHLLLVRDLRKIAK